MPIALEVAAFGGASSRRGTSAPASGAGGGGSGVWVTTGSAMSMFGMAEPAPYCACTLTDRPAMASTSGRRVLAGKAARMRRGRPRSAGDRVAG
ncbi:hypothetical protein D3C72_1522420 [compost metagenome]